MEVYTRSRSFSYIDDDGSGCTNNKDRYMRINMAKCENKNSRRECSAMANGDTRSNRSTRKLAGFLMCSTALSHFPSQNYLITEKFTSRKIHILLLTDDQFVPKRDGFKNRQVGEFHQK